MTTTEAPTITTTARILASYFGISPEKFALRPDAEVQLLESGAMYAIDERTGARMDWTADNPDTAAKVAAVYQSLLP